MILHQIYLSPNFIAANANHYKVVRSGVVTVSSGVSMNWGSRAPEGPDL